MAEITRAGVYGRESRGKAKSIADQMELGHELCLEQGWEERTYSDKVSASWFGTKQRGGWNEVLADLDGGELDVLVLWESSRGDRRNTEWSRMLDVCVDRGVLIHIIEHERTYNPQIPRDWETLASEGIKSQSEVLKLSGRVRRGVGLAAKAGRPAAGPVPYGYRRVYDPATGELTGQEADPDTAPIVAEIFRRVSKSEPLSAIADDLNARGVTPPGAASKNKQTSQRWYRLRIRNIALSRTYLGERKHKGDWYPGIQPALTDPETFAQAGAILSDVSRAKFGTHARPGKQVHLLTYFATCFKCKGPIRARGNAYDCRNGCVHIKREPVDGLIRDLVVAKLSDPDEYAALKQPGEDAHEEAAAASAEVATLTGELEDWRKSAWDGRGTSPATLAAVEAGLTARIEAAQARFDAATVPDALQGWAGREEDVRARWAAAPVQARRAVLRALEAAGLRVELVPSAQNAYAFLTDRVNAFFVN